MRRPPRAPDEPLFSGRLIGWSLLQGAFAFALVGRIFVVASRSRHAGGRSRALAFFSLVLTIVSLIFVNRSFSASLLTALRRPNHALAWVLWRCGHVGPDPPLALRKRSLSLRAASLRRSRIDVGAGAVVLVALEFLNPSGENDFRARLRLRFMLCIEDAPPAP